MRQPTRPEACSGPDLRESSRPAGARTAAYTFTISLPVFSPV